MIRRTIMLSSLLFLLFSGTLQGQDMAKYKKYVKAGKAFYDQGEFVKAAKCYDIAFAAVNDTGTIPDRYQAACANAEAGNFDAAFLHLFRIGRSGKFTDLEKLEEEIALNLLHDDERWDELFEMILAHTNQFVQPAADELAAIYDSSQKARQEIREIGEAHGWDSDEVFEQYNKILQQDSLAFIKVKSILDQHGWLGEKEVGPKGSKAIYLSLHHANWKDQEKYLPALKKAIEEKKAKAGNLARLEDKIAVAKGERQIYGSQVQLDEESGKYFVVPLKDPDNVDKRRASLGLIPFAEYLKQWNIEWDPEAYKALLPTLEDRMKAISYRQSRSYWKFIYQNE